MVNKHQRLADVVAGRHFECPRGVWTAVGTAGAPDPGKATTDPAGGADLGLEQPQRARVALTDPNETGTRVDIAARLRLRAANKIRSVQWVLTILLLTLPVSGFAQPSKTPASLEPTKPSQIVVLQSQLTPCPAGAGAGFWLDIQTRPDGTTAYFPGIPTGQVLVLTGVSFVADRGGLGTDSAQIVLSNFSLPPSTSGPAPPLLFHTAVRAEGVNRVGGAAPLHNVVIKPGTALCVWSDFLFVTGVVTGFLTEDQ